MTKRRFILVMCLLVLGAIMLSSCGSSTEKNESPDRKKVKVDKKKNAKQAKKKKYLDTFGENLTQKARENKDWAESDKIRDLIKEKGYIVKDSKEGQTIEKI